jgi:hypothetical protein
MIKKDLSLNFSCPICGAEPSEKCELNSGTARFESHRERRDIARDEDDEDAAPAVEPPRTAPSGKAPRRRAGAALSVT